METEEITKLVDSIYKVREGEAGKGEGTMYIGLKEITANERECVWESIGIMRVQEIEWGRKNSPDGGNNNTYL